MNTWESLNIVSFSKLLKKKEKNCWNGP